MWQLGGKLSHPVGLRPGSLSWITWEGRGSSGPTVSIPQTWGTSPGYKYGHKLARERFQSRKFGRRSFL